MLSFQQIVCCKSAKDRTSMSVTFQQMRTLSCCVREAVRESASHASHVEWHEGTASLLMEDGAFSNPLDATPPASSPQVSLGNDSTPTLPPKKSRTHSDIVALSTNSASAANTAGKYEKVTLGPRVQSTLDLLRTEGVRMAPFPIVLLLPHVFVDWICCSCGAQTS